MTFTPTYRRGDRVLDSRDGRGGLFQRYNGNGTDAVVTFDDGPAAVPFASLRHAPVVVLGNHCPHGHPLTLMDAERADGTPVKVAACGFCEFIKEP